jgi:hypothetical protein
MKSFCSKSDPSSKSSSRDHSLEPIGRFVKTKFTPEEDDRLIDIVNRRPGASWVEIASAMRTRNPRQCRERYKNYLDPHLRRDDWTEAEDHLLTQKYVELGPKWNQMSKLFVGRSDIALRNRHMALVRRQGSLEINGETVQPLEPEGPDVLDIPQGRTDWECWHGENGSFDPWSIFDTHPWGEDL